MPPKGKGKGGSGPAGKGTSSGASNKPKAFQSKSPIAAPDLGKLLHVKDTTRPAPHLVLPKNGVPTVKTTLVDDPAQKVEVYSLTFWRPSLNPKTPNALVELNKKSEIKLIFDALQSVNALGLNAENLSWATDYKDLWCSAALKGPTDEMSEWDTTKVSCRLLDGKQYEGVYATVKFSTSLENIRHDLQSAPITEVSDHIRALNAFVARYIRQHSNSTKRSVTQLGANKFYRDDAFTRMKNERGDLGLRAVRDYYTSIRPCLQGPLLNINAATTAFLNPVLVSQLLDVVVVSKEEGTMRNQKRYAGM
ncbi:hypothetical protein CC86DRAFT_413794 [Ophiobolus disseminans]|uniref:Argonaute linker 1 domain-containing protein n=1 Tax=Ophiobolus disseminans TaxID=1469910 RepID=A0A6A6ZEG3_9PLEO|nr:hypothetical protein CC86DRAFT_413794 [Ophiobolus disseminans]